MSLYLQTIGREIALFNWAMLVLDMKTQSKQHAHLSIWRLNLEKKLFWWVEEEQEKGLYWLGSKEY